MRGGKLAAATACAASLFTGEPDVGAAARASDARPDSSVLVLAGTAEPGTRLVVTGRVLRGDGRPAARERIAVYHTDALGEYGTHPSGRSSFPGTRDAWLSGWLVTDPAGRFTLRTIRPGAYPGGGTPQHIHFVVGERNQELLFADDPILRRRRGGTGESEGFQVRPVRTDANGVQHVSIDLHLR